MSTKWYGLLFCGTMLSLLALSACAPALVGGASAIADATETTMAENGSVVVEGSDSPVTVAGSASGEPGSTGPGAAEGDTNTEPGAGAAPSATMLTYSDQTYKFSVDYPDNFEVRPAPAPDLQALSPTPSASFLFLSPIRSLERCGGAGGS